MSQTAGHTLANTAWQTPSPRRGTPPEPPYVEMPSVWTSPSFWVSIATAVAAIVGFFLHEQIDITPIAGAIGLIAAAIATGALAIARALRHKAVLEANLRAASLRHESFYMNQERDELVSHDQLQHVLNQIHHDLSMTNNRVSAIDSQVSTAKKPAAKKPAAKKTAAAKR